MPATSEQHLDQIVRFATVLRPLLRYQNTPASEARRQLAAVSIFAICEHAIDVRLTRRVRAAVRKFLTSQQMQNKHLVREAALKLLIPDPSDYAAVYAAFQTLKRERGRYLYDCVVPGREELAQMLDELITCFRILLPEQPHLLAHFAALTRDESQ